MSKKKEKKTTTPPCCDRGHPKKGERVAIIREEHGWHDGRIEGSVIHVHCAPPSRVSYTVRADDGSEYFCPKTNDVRALGRSKL